MKAEEMIPLSLDEIASVSGGLQDGYKYCAGDGVRPSYATCPVNMADYIQAFLDGVEQGKRKGQKT
ncbi:MAG: hypothetical protein AB7E81_13385 [Hyphomicrobiaceae bacterium]